MGSALDAIEEILNFIQFGMLAAVTVLTVKAIYQHRGVRMLVLLGGAYACFLMGDLFITLYYIIIGDWPFVFSVADISYIGMYCFLIVIALEHIGAWTGEQRQTAKHYRYAAIVAPVCVVLSLAACVVFYPDILFACIMYCIPLPFLGYYSLLAFFVSRKTRDEKPSMYSYHKTVLLFLLIELVMFMLSSYMYTDIMYLINYILDFLIYVPTVMLLPALRKGVGI